MNLQEMLGINLDDPNQRLARDLVEADEKMLDELVAIRQAHLTQTDVGGKMGISQGAVARIESGERDPHLSTLRRYAFAVGAVVTHHVGRMEPNRQVNWTDASASRLGVAWSETIPTQAKRIDDSRTTRVPLTARVPLSA